MLKSGTEEADNIKPGAVSTLAFFGLFGIPVSAKRVFEFLYKAQSGPYEVEKELETLSAQGKIFKKNDKYSLQVFSPEAVESACREKEIRLKKIEKHYKLFYLLPFVKMTAFINSVAIGNASPKSDIDIFVLTKRNRLYFARSWAIAVFKLLGLYKSKKQVSNRFCFGFYLSQNALNIESIALTPEDPYMAFWLASMQPIFGKKEYLQFISANPWIFKYLPNFMPIQRFYGIKTPPFWLKICKIFLEMVFYVPAIFLEPVLAKIHIKHTFNLPENHWPTSTTVANRHMLKLHALDPRPEIRKNFQLLLEKLF